MAAVEEIRANKDPQSFLRSLLRPLSKAPLPWLVYLCPLCGKIIFFPFGAVWLLLPVEHFLAQIGKKVIRMIKILNWSRIVGFGHQSRIASRWWGVGLSPLASLDLWQLLRSTVWCNLRKCCSAAVCKIVSGKEVDVVKKCPQIPAQWARWHQEQKFGIFLSLLLHVMIASNWRKTHLHRASSILLIYVFMWLLHTVDYSLSHFLICFSGKFNAMVKSFSLRSSCCKLSQKNQLSTAMKDCLQRWRVVYRAAVKILF